MSNILFEETLKYASSRALRGLPMPHRVTVSSWQDWKTLTSVAPIWALGAGIIKICGIEYAFQPNMAAE
jgi:hypothetical protein